MTKESICINAKMNGMWQTIIYSVTVIYSHLDCMHFLASGGVKK